MRRAADYPSRAWAWGACLDPEPRPLDLGGVLSALLVALCFMAGFTAVLAWRALR